MALSFTKAHTTALTVCNFRILLARLPAEQASDLLAREADLDTDPVTLLPALHNLGKYNENCET